MQRARLTVRYHGGAVGHDRDARSSRRRAGHLHRRLAGRRAPKSGVAHRQNAAIRHSDQVGDVTPRRRQSIPAREPRAQRSVAVEPHHRSV
jgi:hypothetical protein